MPNLHGFRRSTAHYAESDTVGQSHDKKSPFPANSVGARLDPTVDEATKECEKADTIAWRTEWSLNIAVFLQVLLGALTTALGAALSGKNTSVAISTLGGAATVVASYLARSRSSNEPAASRDRATALSHFLREIKGFQLDYGFEAGHEWDHRIRGFRLGLEQMLGNKPGSVAIHPEAGGANTIPDPEKRVGTTDPAQGFGQGFAGAGVFPHANGANKFGFNPA
jgi:hypothetical protein